MTEIIVIIGLVVAAYLLGSIPTAVIVSKLFFKTDIRNHGSGNAGATNILRTFGTAAAIPVFVIDGAKGYAAVMISWLSTLAPTDAFDHYSEPFINLRIALMIAAIIGHIFPIFASFKGGKGVATIAGCLIAIAPIPLICSFTMFVIFWSTSNYLSLGSIMAGLTFPIWVILWYIILGDGISPTMSVFSVVVSAMLVYTHRSNIKRIKEGTESKTYLFRK